MRAKDVEVLVTGGTGLIGRWLLAELTRRGRSVAALVRDADAREAELRAFVAAKGGDTARLLVLAGDIEVEGLGLATDLPEVRDVYHCAARFAFGLRDEEARRSNVAGALEVAEWALARPHLRRFVHVGGYRMTRLPAWLAAAGEPLDRRALHSLYADHGAYEASKVESYLALRAFAARGLPWTAVHPSTVIGDSRTGETTQTTGLGELVEGLFHGRVPALAGDRRTFVPVIPVDHLAAFMASIPERPDTLGKELCVLDPSTPLLPELVARLAAHLGVRAPTLTLPVPLVRALPRAISGVEPESLSFLVADRYDTRDADAHAEAVGLSRPPLDRSLARWCDHLVATRFGRDPGADRGTVLDAGSRTYCVGDPREDPIVYLHGLPWNGDSWKPVADLLGGARVDLPEHGRSGAAQVSELEWLNRLLDGRQRPVVLVGHSYGAGLAARLAQARPDRVAALILVSPAFLQAPPPWWMRLWPLVARSLRRASAPALGARILPASPDHPAVASAHRDLARPGVAATIARELARGAASRDELRDALRQVAAPTLLIHGSRDPLIAAPSLPVRVIEGAGHVPQLTHAAAVADAIAEFLAAHRVLEPAAPAARL